MYVTNTVPTIRIAIHVLNPASVFNVILIAGNWTVRTMEHIRMVTLAAKILNAEEPKRRSRNSGTVFSSVRCRRPATVTRRIHPKAYP